MTALREIFLQLLSMSLTSSLVIAVICFLRPRKSFLTGCGPPQPFDSSALFPSPRSSVFFPFPPQGPYTAQALSPG